MGDSSHPNISSMVFHDVVFKAIIEKDDLRQEIEDAEEEEFQAPSVVGTTLDLTRKNIKRLPEVLLERSPHVQYLYLEGNQLTELPADFFDQLFSLKWLDLRMNHLMELPTAGLAGHPHLETVLLQGNVIKTLPVELGNVPNLKGLQISGNPITNIPQDVIARGFQEIIKYLRYLDDQPDLDSKKVELKDNEVDQSTEATADSASMDTAEFEKIDFTKPKKKKISKLPSAERGTLNSALNVYSYLDGTKANALAGLRRKATRGNIPVHCTERGPFRPFSALLPCAKPQRPRVGYKTRPLTMKMVQEKTIKEIRAAQMRETLQRQAQIIQRMKDVETLKEWRRHARQSEAQLKLLDNYQQYPSKDFSSKTPFDVDPDFLNMLSRVDLYQNIKDMEMRRTKKRKGRQQKMTAGDLENQMAQVLEKLKQLDVEEVTSSSSKQTVLVDKMRKISELQNVLRNLHAQNQIIGGPVARKKNPRSVCTQ